MGGKDERSDGSSSVEGHLLRPRKGSMSEVSALNFSKHNMKTQVRTVILLVPSLFSFPASVLLNISLVT